jgi:hypothetical protein
VETQIILLHGATGCSAQAGERRSQQQNKGVALFRLRLVLALEVRCAVSKAPSPRWQARCRKGSLRVNPSHADFPPLLAEALDHIFVAGLDARTAAEKLNCSPTQLIKFVKQHPPALRLWNKEREAQSLHPLR